MSAASTDTLTAGLRDGFGAALRAVVLYGAAAADEPIAASEVHALVLVDELPLEALERAGAQVARWSAAGYPAPLVLTLAEWESSADIYSMEYADILERHRVLHGALPREGIRVAPTDLRLAVEREALSTVLQLRRSVIAAGGVPERLAQLLAASLPSVLAVFRGVLRVHGLRPDTDSARVCAETAFRANIEAAPFVAVLEHRQRGALVEADDAHGILASYLAQLERLVAHLDAVRPAAPAHGSAA